MGQHSKDFAVVASYAKDQLAAIRHTLEAVERHCEDKTVQAHPDVHRTLSRVRDALEHQRSSLAMHIEREFDGLGAEGTIKEAMTSVSGFVAGLYGKVRNDTVSRMLRDDVTAVHFLATCYSMLYATAAAFGEQKTATISTTHLHELTPLVIELSRAIPPVVVDELVEDGYQVSTTAIRAALDEVADAWRGDHVKDHAPKSLAGLA